MKGLSHFALACFTAELVGTFLLVLLGDGAIATYVLTKQPIDVFSACISFGVGAMLACIAGAKISGAHINPAATLAFALNGQLRWTLVPVYMIAQYLGGFLAAALLYLNNMDAIAALDSSRTAFGGSNATGSIFATYPGSWVTLTGSILDQILGTAVLLFGISAITDKRNLNVDSRLQPLYVALTIGVTCVAFTPNCGAIFNPARDLAPRLLTALAGYSKPSVFAPLDGWYWLTAGLVGPHLGAIAGVFGYKFFIGRAYNVASAQSDFVSNES